MMNCCRPYGCEPALQQLRNAEEDKPVEYIASIGAILKEHSDNALETM